MRDDDLPPGKPCPINRCYGVSPEQYRTDIPPPGPSNMLPQASVHPAAVLVIALVVGLAIAWSVGVSTVFAPETPMPTPASREASLARQVEALSTRVVELEWRNTATLAALSGFAPVPTSTHEPNWTYTGPYTALNGNAR